jgi:hypothetical protein
MTQTTQKNMSKAAKWSALAVATPVVLLIVLFLLFYFPPFQNWAVKQVAAYASEQTGITISIEHVRLQFPLDLRVEGVKAIKPNDSIPHLNDTIADIRELVVDIKLLPLFRSEVDINTLSFKQMKVNTDGLIASARIKGRVGQLYLADANKVNWKESLVDVSTLHLENSQLDIALSDTVPPDTTPSESHWVIKAKELQLVATDFTLHTAGDTMSVNAYFGHTIAQHAQLDLGKSIYDIAHLDWQGGKLHYDQNYVARQDGFDPSHLALSNLLLKADSFHYGGSGLSVKLNQCHFREKCGLVADSLHGIFAMDSTRLWLREMNLSTPESHLLVDFAMDLNAFEDKNPGKLSAVVHGRVGKQDIMTLAGNLPAGFKRGWPNLPLTVHGVLKGNMQKAHITGLNLSLPTAFKCKASGFLANLTNPDRFKADIKLEATTYRLDFLTAMLSQDVLNTIRIPSGIGFDGRVQVDGPLYASQFTATQGGGSIKGSASFDTKRMAYNARLAVNAFPLQNFVPNYGLHPFTGFVQAEGAGTDFLSPRTHLKAQAKIEQFQYGSYSLDQVNAVADMSGGRLRANIDSRNKLLNGLINVDALTTGKRLRATVSCDLENADFYNLHITDTPFSAALCAHVDLETDMKQYFGILGSVSDITLRDNKKVYRPGDVELDVISSRDTTHAVVQSGDFLLDMDGAGGYQKLISQANGVLAEMQKQFKERNLDQLRLRSRLPDVRIQLETGRDNLFCNLLKHYGVLFKSISMDMASSPLSGLNGTLYADSLVASGFEVDTVRFNVQSDSANTFYHAQLRNNKKNPNYIFNALFDGQVRHKGTELKASVYDWEDKLGIRFTLQGSMEQNGLRFHLVDDNPVLGYKEFSVNDSNYVFLSNDRRVSADLVLKAADGMGLQVFTNDENTAALQDLTVSMHQFNIGDALAMVPYTPNVEGILDGDFHIVKTPENITLSSLVDVKDMVYEGIAMGNLGSEFTYMPRDDGSHYVDGTLSREGSEVASFSGTYHTAGEKIDAKVNLEEFPLELFNGFIPEKIIGFRGKADGQLSVDGSLSKPDVNGELYLDSAYMFSEPYGAELRFANDPVTINGSQLLFENFEIFAHNDSPLNVKGSCDFSDLSKIKLDALMRARNFLIIDSKETSRSEVYGKAYVNFFGSIRGYLDNLQMRGRLDVLGSTDVKYNLKDSPLTTDNQLEELVEFVDFNDTVKEVVSRPPLTGFDMDLSINVDEGANIDCYLNADHSNYVNAEGGGSMRLQYNVVDDIRLTGRYTIGSGEMKYSLPVIPLKTFTIQDGSYIEFRGEPMNPTLNITATEETKASVSTDGGTGRIVKFECGVVVTQTLNNMGLEFIIDAPEDMTVHNQLQAMSKEDRGKLAVTMLTTGMYLADGNTSSFSMNSALSAFLNSQINMISNSALRSLDVSVGIENTTDGTGSIHTDYSFKFAKRFWNNRLRIIVGGRLSTGNDVTNDNESFFDNVTFEYRLSPTSNKYLKLFYERDSYDWLEGSVGKYGGGFTWKRKARHFKDLFKFKSDRDVPPPAPNDSISKDSIKTKK